MNMKKCYRCNLEFENELLAKMHSDVVGHEIGDTEFEGFYSRQLNALKHKIKN